MSRCEIYAVRENGDVEPYGEARNSFGGALHVWMTLVEKYDVPRGEYWLADPEHKAFSALWQRTADLPDVADRWVLASTFDHVIVPKVQIATLANHLRDFIRRYPSSTLEEEAAILDRAVGDPDVRGVCFNQTSVCSNPWWVREEQDDEGEPTREGRPYNVDRDAGHWFLTPESVRDVQTEGMGR